eukprot:4780024-Pleurochrysis_carterae.AAC.1
MQLPNHEILRVALPLPLLEKLIFIREGEIPIIEKVLRTILKILSVVGNGLFSIPSFVKPIRMDSYNRTSICFAPLGISWPNSFIAIGIWRWLPKYGDSFQILCVVSLKWLAKSFAFNAILR